jgi:hypothetical protein
LVENEGNPKEEIGMPVSPAKYLGIIDRNKSPKGKHENNTSKITKISVCFAQYTD